MRCVMCCAIQRIAPRQDLLEAPEHLTGDIRARHLAVFDFHLD
jgi:hypothetical protein